MPVDLLTLSNQAFFGLQKPGGGGGAQQKPCYPSQNPVRKQNAFEHPIRIFRFLAKAKQGSPPETVLDIRS